MIGMSAVIFIPDDTAKTGYPQPLMLQSVMGAPLLAWLANALFDSGVGRFFLVCHDRYVEAARACLPAEAEVMTTMDSDPADLLHVFLSTAEDAEHTITVVTGPAVYLPQLAPQAAGRFPRVYGVSREELMQALDEHFSFARFLLDNGSPMNEEQAMYSVASPAELPEIAGLLQRNRLLALARTGVEIYDASSCYVEPSVRVAPGARLLPGTMLRGKTVIGEEAVIGPWSVIDDSVIGARAVVNASQVRDSRVGQDAVVGPYASVRGGCELGRSVRAGSFVELKNARLGENTQVPSGLPRRHRGRCQLQLRLRRDHRELRPRAEARDRRGRGRLYRLQHRPHRPAAGRQRRLHRRRLHHHGGRPRAGARHCPRPPVQQEGMGRQAQEIIHRARKILSAVRMRRSENREVTK